MCGLGIWLWDTLRNLGIPIFNAMLASRLLLSVLLLFSVAGALGPPSKPESFRPGLRIPQRAIKSDPSKSLSEERKLGLQWSKLATSASHYLVERAEEVCRWALSISIIGLIVQIVPLDRYLPRAASEHIPMMRIGIVLGIACSLIVSEGAGKKWEKTTQHVSSAIVQSSSNLEMGMNAIAVGLIAIAAGTVAAAFVQKDRQ